MTAQGTLLKGEWIRLLILIAVGFFVYFHYLTLSFGNSEVFYASITREMIQTKRFLQLHYKGKPYFNKPPLFFWLLALSIHVFGEHEFALRLPGALFSLGR